MERYNLIRDHTRAADSSCESMLRRLDASKGSIQGRKAGIMCNSIPFREHRVSCLADDFYTNLVSWSHNCIVYGIEDKIFAFNLLTSRTKVVLALEDRMISSVYFSPDGTKLAVGCNTGIIDLLDMNALKAQQYSAHRSRVGVIEWSGSTFFTGSRDRQIKLVDPRLGVMQTWMSNHLQEICGLKLNCCRSLLASGGNDNLVVVHDSRVPRYPVHTIRSHRAAVKALSWSPVHPYSMVSGGGTADKTIKMWDISTNTPAVIKSLDTRSQVCNLHWTESNHIISTHGYSQNDSRVFSEGLLLKFTNRGHRNRVIHFAVSTDEQYYLTGSSDNVLNIWRTCSPPETLNFR